MRDRMILKTFSFRHEAEFFRSLLEAHEIESSVDSDDCGMMDPALGYVNGVRLSVASKDYEEAGRIIASTATDGTDTGA